ncbi:MAG TPA: tetratricopeptide repeat protein [Candidatus Paceibacterota bacterium]|nr:tetratricopeptide repeat protein [Candidatus Paceibacterota bacterium]
MQDTPARPRFSFDLASTWLLCATAVLSIVVLVPTATLSQYGLKTFVLGFGAVLTLIAFIIARLVRSSLPVPPLRLLGALWLIPLAYLLSTLFSGVHPVAAAFGVEFETDTLGFVLILAFLATLSALVIRRREDFKALALALGAGIALMLVAQAVIIVAARFVPSLAPTTNLIGTFSDFGMLAGLGAVFALLALRILPLSRRMRIVTWVVLALSLVALILVNIVPAWVLVGILALGLFVESLMHRRGDQQATFPTTEARGKKIIISSAVTLLITIFFLIGSSTIGSAIASSLGINTLDVRPSWQSTFLIGSHTYASSPLFGSGPGTFSEQWLKFRDRGLNDTIFWSVDFGAGIGHIPTSMVTTGLLGAIAWLVFLGLFIYAGVRTLLFHLPEEHWLRFATIGSFAGASYLLLLALFAVPGPVMLALGFILIGAFISAGRFASGRGEATLEFAKSPRIGFAVVFFLTLLLLASVVAGYLVLERFLAGAYYGQATSSLRAGDLDRADAAVVRSLTFAPTERAYRLAAAVGIERMRRIASDTSLPVSTAQQQFQEALTRSISAGLEATRLGQTDYQNWSVLATVYQSVAALQVEGAYEEAKASYERALALNPSNPALPYALAQLEIIEGNTEAAEELLLSSINLKRDYIPAILLLSQLEIQSGKATEALQAAEAAAYFAPNDPAVLFQVGLLRSGIGDVDGAITALARAVELNPQYANARFFLSAMYATKGQYTEALTELRAVASFSEENAAAVADDIAALEQGTNPFPTTRLRSLGIPQPPVTEPAAPAN